MWGSSIVHLFVQLFVRIVVLAGIDILVIDFCEKYFFYGVCSLCIGNCFYICVMMNRRHIQFLQPFGNSGAFVVYGGVILV